MIYHDVEKCCMNENGMIVAKYMEDAIVLGLTAFDDLPFNELEAPLQAAFYAMTHDQLVLDVYHERFCEDREVTIPMTKSTQNELHQIFTSCMNFQICRYKMARRFKGEGKGDGGI